MGINKDQVEGRAKQAGGKVQEAVGKAVGSEKQQVQGAANQASGKVQATVGDIKQKAKDAFKDRS